jgi:hypothetical protein
MDEIYATTFIYNFRTLIGDIVEITNTIHCLAPLLYSIDGSYMFRQ